MNIAITSNDQVNISDFNSKIFLFDTTTNTQKEISYIESLKFADIFVTAHLDGFASENIKQSGITPVIYRGNIKDAINELKDCGIKRDMPYGENYNGCGACEI